VLSSLGCKKLPTRTMMISSSVVSCIYISTYFNTAVCELNTLSSATLQMKVNHRDSMSRRNHQSLSSCPFPSLEAGYKSLLRSLTLLSPSTSTDFNSLPKNQHRSPYDFCPKEMSKLAMEGGKLLRRILRPRVVESRRLQPHIMFGKRAMWDPFQENI
jgi:hypothetical protein